MFKLTGRIVRRTELPYEKVLSILYSGISTGYGNHLFSDKIMTGRINSGKIKAVINPPKGWSDPFKSRVNGTVNHGKEGTNLELTTYTATKMAQQQIHINKEVTKVAKINFSCYFCIIQTTTG